MTKTKSKSVTVMAIAAVLVTAVLVYTLVCMLSGNITPLCRVTGLLLPVWFLAELDLLCTLL